MQYYATPTWWQDRNITFKATVTNHTGPDIQLIIIFYLLWNHFLLSNESIHLQVCSTVLGIQRLSLSEDMLSSRANFFQLSLKIEESNESCSDLMGLFNSEGGSYVF